MIRTHLKLNRMNKEKKELGYYKGFRPATPCPSDSLELGSNSSSRTAVRSAGNPFITPFNLR